LCERHYHYYKRHKELHKFPLMQREHGTGQIFLGYKRISVNKRRILEHRHVVEQKLKRRLLPTETIHHLDGNKLNNKLNNLIVIGQSEHITKFHNNRPRVFNWNKYEKKKTDICIICQKRSIGNFNLCPSHYRTWRYWKVKHK